MLEEFFKRENIEFYAELAIEDVFITDTEKMKRLEEKYFPIKSIVLFLMPYYSGQKTTNLSKYAKPYDYHYYIRCLSERLSEFAGKDFGFFGMADTSPIDERGALLKTGLCALGKNGLCINEKYGSYFFIGEFFLPEKIAPIKPMQTKNCLSCGKCEKACPTGAIFDPERKKCLSLLTQKKELTAEEKKLVDEAQCKWGCDICQNVCPMNENAALTPIPFFRENLTDSLSESEVFAEKEEFSKRAYSWRGREILKRNLGIPSEKK